MDINIQEMLSNMMPHRSRTRRMTVAEARKVLIQQSPKN
jgi:ATP-dependent protease HslVU (ClpYQ) ATPase subunit